MKYTLLSISFMFIFTFSCIGRDTLDVAFANAPPFIINENDEPEGINIWLWERVAEELNLDYRYYSTDFPEMLNNVKESKVDISINPLTVTSSRNKTMDFTHSFFVSNSSIVIKVNSSLERFIRIVRTIFSVNFLRGLSILLFTILFFALLTWQFEKNKNSTQFRPGWKGIMDGIWWSLVTMTTVGYGDKVPKSRGGKIVAILWMFSGLLFISGFTASIASNLTLLELQSNPNGFQAYKDKEVGSIKNSSADEFLKDHFFKNVADFSNVQSGLNALKDNKIEGFIYDEPILRYRLKEDKSYKNLSILPDKFDLQFYAFALPKKHTTLTDSISVAILEIMESRDWRIILNEYGLEEI